MNNNNSNNNNPNNSHNNYDHHKREGAKEPSLPFQKLSKVFSNFSKIWEEEILFIYWISVVNFNINLQDFGRFIDGQFSPTGLNN